MPDLDLSFYERALLDHLAAGMKDGAIARMLGISDRGVRRLRVRLHRKLGARSDPHAIAVAVSWGLLDLS